MCYDRHITVYPNSLFLAEHDPQFDICHFPFEIAQNLGVSPVNIVCKQMRSATLRNSAHYKCALRVSCYAGHVPPIDKGHT